MPTASSLVVSMFVDEVVLPGSCRNQLEMSDGSTTSTVGEVDNAIYFTREQFFAELRFLVSSLVKQFLHFTRAPPALIHLNFFQILTSCNVLNSLYNLDISVVEICFNYTLKIRTGGAACLCRPTVPGCNL